MSDTQNNQTDTPVNLTDDQILARTQRIRLDIVDSIVKNGAPIPVEGAVSATLLATLKDLDKQVIDKKRIAVDAGANETTKQAASMIAKILQRIPGADAMNKLSQPTAGRAAPVVSDNVHAPEAVVGEMEQGVVDDTYDSFIERTKR